MARPSSPPTPLPIDARIPEILASLARAPSFVLQATPGSGKTTRVPPALLQADFLPRGGEILVLEPRRLAAKLAAERVAEERGERAGETVGYQFRFENVASPRTRLRFLTEGMLLRRLIGDPELHGVSCVVLDEFHERHLHGDVALAWVRQLQRNARPELRIVVMSATLEAEPIAEFLGGAPIFKAELPMHPVKIEHLEAPAGARALETLVREAVREAQTEPGDILVFLPGMAEIRRAETALAREFGRTLLLAPLHGELTRAEQDFALQPPPSGMAKVILATNIAETSLTIAGVRTVIDSGLQRTASYSWWSGVPALRTRPMSRASAVQRAGRAGRTAPGRCLRLYTRGELEGRAAFDVPEIERADLSQTVLELKALGAGDLASFRWFQAPPERSLTAVCTLLYRLGALTTPGLEAKLTPRGRELATIPAHPRIGRLLQEGSRLGVLDQAATLGALLYDGALEGLDALAQANEARFGEITRRTRTQLRAAVRAPVPAGAGAGGGTRDPGRALARAVLAGFPDRVARRKRAAAQPARGAPGARGELEAELLLAGGGSAWVSANALGPLTSEGDTFVLLDVQERQGTGQVRGRLEVRSLAAIDPDWLLELEPLGVRDEEELRWDSERERIFSSTRLMYDELILSETVHAPAHPESPASPSSERAAALLAKEALGLSPATLAALTPIELAKALGPLGEDPDAVEATLARLELVATQFPRLGVPAFEPATLRSALFVAIGDRRSRRELGEIDWPKALLEAFAPGLQHRIDQLVPLMIALPSGRRARVQYRLGTAPWLESRLQDFFGLAQGPAILEGRVPLTLHLLAPNQRAVQITTDLPGFWQRHYPEIRRELSRRYPRHKWPEKPNG